MTSREAVESFEIERKYHVSDSTEVPSAQAFASIDLVLGELVVHHLEAEYFDTPALALGSMRFAVRRRRGGVDEGWHLKEKSDEGAREFTWPLTDAMPEELQAMILARVGTQASEEIDVVALLRTERRARSLSRVSATATATATADAEGDSADDGGADVGVESHPGGLIEVAELVDDRVHAHNVLRGVSESWREWEAELAPGADLAELDEIETVLHSVGAHRVHGTSKIQRTMQLGS